MEKCQRQARVATSYNTSRTTFTKRASVAIVCCRSEDRWSWRRLKLANRSGKWLIGDAAGRERWYGHTTASQGAPTVRLDGTWAALAGGSRMNRSVALRESVPRAAEGRRCGEPANF